MMPSQPPAVAPIWALSASSNFLRRRPLVHLGIPDRCLDSGNGRLVQSLLLRPSSARVCRWLCAGTGRNPTNPFDIFYCSRPRCCNGRSAEIPSRCFGLNLDRSERSSANQTERYGCEAGCSSQFYHKKTGEPLSNSSQWKAKYEPARWFTILGIKHTETRILLCI